MMLYGHEIATLEVFTASLWPRCFANYLTRVSGLDMMVHVLLEEEKSRDCRKTVAA